MIELTNLRGEIFMIHPIHIELIDSCPDTRVQLTTGKQLYVQQTPSEVSEAVRGWYRSVSPDPAMLSRGVAISPISQQRHEPKHGEEIA